MLLWLLACSSTAPVPEPVPVPVSQARPDPQDVEPRQPLPEVVSVPASAVEGTYVSMRCGQRSYPVHLSLTEQGSYQMEERISPCPADTTCVWSGIVIHKGAFSLEADEITLSEPKGGAENGPDLGQEMERLYSKTAEGLMSKRGCLFARQ